MSINISDFDYFLPENKIAKHPVEPREQSKLLYYNAGEIKNHSFLDIDRLLPENSFLVANNTKVIPARLLFKKETGAAIEIFLLSPFHVELSVAMQSVNACLWKCIVGNKKKWKLDEKLTLYMPSDLIISAVWHNYEENIIEFKWNSKITLSEVLNIIGQIPLPPYLNRKAEVRDLDNYQTIFSKNPGAVAAPTAALHFSDAILEKLKLRNISIDYVTLHVGAGTFLPVKVENVLDHEMHCEEMVFSKTFIENLLLHIDKVIAVGTTSMRSLESLFWFGQKLFEDSGSEFYIPKLYAYEVLKPIKPDECLKVIIDYMSERELVALTGKTEIMIMPGYDFKLCKGLITNFHQPKSTLLLLVAALVGDQNWRLIYNHALDNDYRFLSFGDSSLLIK